MDSSHASKNERTLQGHYHNPSCISLRIDGLLRRTPNINGCVFFLLVFHRCVTRFHVVRAYFQCRVLALFGFLFLYSAPIQFCFFDHFLNVLQVHDPFVTHIFLNLGRVHNNLVAFLSWQKRMRARPKDYNVDLLCGYAFCFQHQRGALEGRPLSFGLY